MREARLRRRLEGLLRRLRDLEEALARAKRQQEFDAAFRQPGMILAGCDEVGRGPLAGPIVAAAVILPPGVFLPGLRDSKELPPGQRERLADRVARSATAWSLSVVPPQYIDRAGIVAANDLAILGAVAGLSVRPDLTLVDGPRCPSGGAGLVAVVDGDAKSQLVAAAAVLAKVARDRLMRRLGEDCCPGYGWERNAGYGTAEHRRAVAQLGVTVWHRRTFVRGLGRLS